MKRLAVAIATIVALVAAARAADPVVIRPEPLKVNPGEPLSILALVSSPAPLKGARSWTIETPRHRGWLYVMARSPDGQQLATGGLDGTIRIWDAQSGKLIRALVGHNSYVFGLAWSPDGNTLASTGSWDGSVRLWDNRTGRLLRTFTGEFRQYAQHVLWTPSGESIIATGDTSGRAVQWNAVSGKHVHTVEHGNTINGVACSPDGRNLACGCTNLAVQLWDLPLAGKTTPRTVGESGKTAGSVAWSPDSKTLAYGSSDGKTYLWERGEAKQRSLIELGPYYLSWSPDGKTLAMSLSTGDIQLVDAGSGKLLKTLPRTDGGGYLSAPSGLLWSPDNKTVASGGAQHVVVHGVDDPKEVRTHQVAASVRLQWSPGRPILSGIGDKSLSLWDAATLKRLATLEGHTQGIVAAAFAPKTNVLATGANDNTIRLWDTTTGKLLHTLKGHTGPVNAVGWSPDGNTLASGSADKTVRLWRATGGESIRTLEGHATPVAAVAWSPDGKMVASADAQVALVWKTDTWKVAHKLEIFSPIYTVAWSRDNKWLATGEDHETIRIWSAATGKQRAALESGGSPPGVLSVAWSPDGRMLASGRGNFRMQLWDAGSSKLLNDQPGWSPVHRVTWSIGGTTVAGANATSTVRFWNPANGQGRATLVADEQWLAVMSAQGHLGATPQVKTGLVYVVQTDRGQDLLEPREFTERYKWKNLPPFKELSGK
jgi:WD40 repeat protein